MSSAKNPLGIKFDKNVPIPTIKRESSLANHLLALMDVKDSHFFPQGNANTISSTMARFKPKKFVARSVVEKKVYGVRVWRIK